MILFLVVIVNGAYLGRQLKGASKHGANFGKPQEVMLQMLKLRPLPNIAIGSHPQSGWTSRQRLELMVHVGEMETMAVKMPRFERRWFEG